MRTAPETSVLLFRAPQARSPLQTYAFMGKTLSVLCDSCALLDDGKA